MEIEIVLDLGIQISGVLDAAHSTRYSSWDIKPAIEGSRSDCGPDRP